jgi:predicted RNase H-like HicB family nuclease
MHPVNLTFETELEDDGRWLAEVPEIAGIMAYGATEMEAMAKAEALAFRALAEQLERREARPMSVWVSVAAE